MTRRIIAGLLATMAVLAAGQRDAAPQVTPRPCAEDEMGANEPWCVHLEQVIGWDGRLRR